mmetsp:Transcript_52367/g.131556  ORF Transcript_52367/g.131556 Transcript_52367/m.131556 type:complete len:228 (-) Transcript_52367:680-1363(-)
MRAVLLTALALLRMVALAAAAAGCTGDEATGCSEALLSGERRMRLDESGLCGGGSGVGRHRQSHLSHRVAGAHTAEAIVLEEVLQQQRTAHHRLGGRLVAVAPRVRITAAQSGGVQLGIHQLLLCWQQVNVMFDRVALTRTADQGRLPRSSRGPQCGAGRGGERRWERLVAVVSLLGRRSQQLFCRGGAGSRSAGSRCDQSRAVGVRTGGVGGCCGASVARPEGSAV